MAKTKTKSPEREREKERLRAIAAELSPHEMYILVHSPYDRGDTHWGKSAVARSLVERGLLESSPQNRSRFRITAFGSEVIAYLPYLR